MLRPLQAREEGQPGSPTATDNRQHEEPGGSLSHLVSMYGASQNPSHDDTGSPSPEGDKTEVDAREAGCDPTSAPPSGEGAEDHPIREGASQPGEAPPTPGSAEQGHGRRVFAGGGGCEVTEQPAQRAKRAEQPPAEVQGIVAKLLAFVKVRLGPLVYLWRRAVLWCPGAQQGGCWRMPLATVMLMPVRRYSPRQYAPARPRWPSESWDIVLPYREATWHLLQHCFRTSGWS